MKLLLTLLPSLDGSLVGRQRELLNHAISQCAHRIRSKIEELRFPGNTTSSPAQVFEREIDYDSVGPFSEANLRRIMCNIVPNAIKLSDYPDFLHSIHLVVTSKFHSELGAIRQVIREIDAPIIDITTIGDQPNDEVVVYQDKCRRIPNQLGCCKIRMKLDLETLAPPVDLVERTARFGLFFRRVAGDLITLILNRWIDATFGHNDIGVSSTELALTFWVPEEQVYEIAGACKYQLIPPVVLKYHHLVPEFNPLSTPMIETSAFTLVPNPPPNPDRSRYLQRLQYTL